MSIKNRIRAFEKKKMALIKKLFEAKVMLRGSFSVAYRKCGKPTCRCARGEKHPYNRITWSERAKSKIKTIPSQDVDWAKELTGNYRIFRKNRQRLRQLECDQKLLFDQLEDELVGMARKQKPYL